MNAANREPELPQLPNQFMDQVSGAVSEIAAKKYRGRSFAFVDYLGFWVLFGRLPRDSKMNYAVRADHYRHRVIGELEKAGYRIWGKVWADRKGWAIVFTNPCTERDRPLSAEEENGSVSTLCLGSSEGEAKQIAESIAAQVMRQLHDEGREKPAPKGKPKK